jgi:hypothetical protein
MYMSQMTEGYGYFRYTTKMSVFSLSSLSYKYFVSSYVYEHCMS